MSLTATVELFRNASQRMGILSNVTLVQARINANAMLMALEDIPSAFAIIRDGDHVEKLRGPGFELDTDAWYRHPLANIRRGSCRQMLDRHFQMAGAMDQNTVERHASRLRCGSPVKVERFVIEFLTHPTYIEELVNRCPMLIAAKDLRAGDLILGSLHGLTSHNFEVDSVEDANEATVRVRCNDDTITFWLGNDEEVAITR